MKLADSLAAAGALAKNDLSEPKSADSMLKCYLREVKKDVVVRKAQRLGGSQPEESHVEENGKIATCRASRQSTAMVHDTQVTGGKRCGLVWESMRLSHGLWGRLYRKSSPVGRAQ